MSFADTLRDMDETLLVKAGLAANLKSGAAESTQSMVDEFPTSLMLIKMMVDRTILPPDADEQVANMDGAQIEELVEPDPRAYIIGARAAMSNFMSIFVEYCALEQMQQHFPDTPDPTS